MSPEDYENPTGSAGPESSGRKPCLSRLDSVPINTISLFSGGGGMDLGFAAVGYAIKVSLDIDPFSCKTLAINAGKKCYYPKHAVLAGDIGKIGTEELLAASGLRKEEVDMVIGGPPCQAFSVFGKRGGLGDPRGNLIWEYLRVIKEVQPTAFVFENVYGLRTIYNGTLYQKLLEALSCDGKYVVSDHSYELQDYGIPQYRNRIFFIGHKGGRRIPPIAKTHAPPGFFSDLPPYVTVSKVLEGMPEPGKGGLPNHIGRVHSDRIIDRYTKLKHGERDSFTRINKLDPERPSFTIIVGSDAGGGKGHVHPYQPREVTPRESARMQTFPDWWEFHGTGRHVIRQVGNAVPPLFAALLGEHVAKYIFERKEIQSYTALVERLGLDFLR
jgi:DNA (cytosine-5)-methyltransferase 1